jgi:hypothetical protein
MQMYFILKLLITYDAIAILKITNFFEYKFDDKSKDFVRAESRYFHAFNIAGGKKFGKKDLQQPRIPNKFKIDHAGIISPKNAMQKSLRKG